MMAYSFILLALLEGSIRRGAEVQTVRVPDHGLVPEVVIDGWGVWHMTYGKGQAGDAYYVQSKDNGKTFSHPVQLNSRPDTVTTGGERGPKLALGKDGIIHVIWLGYYKKGGGAWYTRSTDGGKSFAKERNLVDPAYGMDNATVTADARGNVMVLWTGGFPGVKSEEDSPAASPIVLVRSADNGKTFSKNELLKSDSPVPGRACGCCRLEARVVADGSLYVPFRAGYKNLRDPYLLQGKIDRNDFHCIRISPDRWEHACPMMGLPFRVDGTGRVLVSWMSRDRVYWSLSAKEGEQFRERVGTPGGAKQDQAYPSAEINRSGDILFTWVEGGEVRWAVFTRAGKLTGRHGTAGRLPRDTKPTLVVGPNDRFFIVF